MAVFLFAGWRVYAAPEVPPSSSLELLDHYAKYDRITSNACGPEALYLAARATGRQVDFAVIRERMTLEEDGCSLQDIREAARELGLRPKTVLLADALRRPNGSSLVVHRKNHFLALIPHPDGHFILVDGHSQPVLCSEKVSRTLSATAVLIPGCENRSGIGRGCVFLFPALGLAGILALGYGMRGRLLKDRRVRQN